MKLARFTDGSLALAINHHAGTGLLDVGASLAACEPTARAAVTAAIGPDARGDWPTLIEEWSSLRDVLQGMIDAAAEQRPGMLVRTAAELGPPLPSRASRIFALGGNFARHIQEASRAVLSIDDDADAALRRRKDQGPWGFMILPDTVTGPHGDIRPPKNLTKIDYEGEVAVVLSNSGRSIRADDLRVWGFTAFNDFSLRDAALGVGPPFDGGPMNWTLQKNFDTGSSCGPWIVVDEPFDVDDLELTTRVNGDLRQKGNTADMIFSFGETVEHLSQFLTIRPGDMIASGTPHGTAVESGLDGPFLKSGDVTEVYVQGIGPLRNRIVTDD